MTLTRIYLLIQAIIFGAFGLYAFFNPQVIIDLLGAPSMSTQGIYEIRSVCGGVSVAIGVLSFVGFLKTHMQRPALYFLLTYTGGYALARIAALPLDGMPSSKMMVFVCFEVISALIALYLLRLRKGVEI